MAAAAAATSSSSSSTSPDPNAIASSPVHQEEHNLIANYCSRLAAYYAQNPHLSPSPPNTATATSPAAATTTTTTKTSLPPNNYSLQPPPAQPQMGIQQLASRTASLSRQPAISTNGLTSTPRSNLKYSTLRPAQQLLVGGTTNVVTTTNRSMSESNFALGNNGSNEDSSDASGSNGNGDYSLDDRLLKEKREIVAKLERQNREIAKEIKRLRIKQQQQQHQQQQSVSTHHVDYSQMDSSDYAALAQQIQQQLQQQQQRSNYANIYASVGKTSRETTPASAFAGLSLPKKSVDPNIIAELRTLKVCKSSLFEF